LSDRLTIRWEPPYRELRPMRQYWDDLKLTRMGVMLHYDASVTDAGGLAWLQGEDVHASYNLVVLDDGAWGIIAPLGKAAWHAGKTRTSDPAKLCYPDHMANHAFYGLCILTNDKVDVTMPQALTGAWLAARLFARHGWSRERELWRVVTHSSEAVYAVGHPKAGQRGRKTDPEGPAYHEGGHNPIWCAADVRTLLPLFADVMPLS
jgi:N-acetyl-anhydromuramyl-L-alanine amidase AmpD